MQLFIILFIVFVLAVLSYAVYFMLSPMPVVRLIRKQKGELPTMPDDCKTAAKRIDLIKDLEYRSDYPKNTYDLFLPKSKEKSPLILWVHGGAFVAGDKIGTENWGILLADKGYAVMSINYCHAPEATYPAQIHQIADALREIINHEYADRIDFENVVVAGDSAGAYMAIQFALCHTNDELSKKLGVVSPLKKDALKGAMLYCGPYNVKKMLNAENKLLRLFISRIGWSFLGKRKWNTVPLISTVTPMDFVTEKTVPCYITDGNTMSFESHGRTLADTLRKNGVIVKERYFSKEDYGEVPHEYQIQLHTENGMLCFNDTLTFLTEIIKKEGNING